MRSILAALSAKLLVVAGGLLVTGSLLAQASYPSMAGDTMPSSDSTGSGVNEATGGGQIAGGWMGEVGAVISLYPQTILHYPMISEDCSRWAASVSNGNADYENMIRHRCWQAMLTIYYGSDVAEGIGDIHEGNNLLNDPNNLPDSYTDDHNNEMGQALGERFLEEHYTILWGYQGRIDWVKEEIMKQPID